MGGASAFILTGVILLAGAVAAGRRADMTVGFICVRSPILARILRLPAAWSVAYAGIRPRNWEAEPIFCPALTGWRIRATLLVGGVFGVIGFLIHYVIGAVLHLNTDLPGFTVIISAVIARLVFGSSGLIGKKPLPVRQRVFYRRKGNAL